MTAVRVLTSKWMLVLGAVAILGLTSGQALADPHRGGSYRPSPGWSGPGSGGYGHQVVPFRGERRFADGPHRGGSYRPSPGWSGPGPGGYGHQVVPFRGERRFADGPRFDHRRPPVVISRPDFGRPPYGGYSRPVCGGYTSGTYRVGGMTITIIVR